MRIRDWIRKYILSRIGLVKSDQPDAEERATFINDPEAVKLSKLQEYNIWYYGDGDELLNFYTQKNTIDYNYEPWFTRNKKSYFWAISSTEDDIKRTHSGQPRNIIDTLVNIMPFPIITTGLKKGKVNENLGALIKETGLRDIYRNRQMPLTLVEGWGCYKINWDLDESDYPILEYYRAGAVDFEIKSGRIKGVSFKDYYTDGENRKYVLIESRSKIRKNCILIRKDLFRLNGDNITPISEDEWLGIPELASLCENRELIIEGYNKLLAVPCIFFENVEDWGGYGRSIFTGKIDLFDDLDQCLSQASNTVRRSTTHEYFNTDFLERDPDTNAPMQPKVYDRKYIMYKGGMNMDGTVNTNQPVQVTQPNVNFQQYSDHATQILMQIINGIMSPATLGIDISKKDNAEAQREKEKVTIFSRNTMADAESEILREVCVQLLDAYSYMHKGRFADAKYDITVQYDEFADDSYENKLKTLSQAYDGQDMSDEMFMRKLYGNSLSAEEWDREIEWLKKHHTEKRDQGFANAGGGGANLEGMVENLIEGDDDEV